MPSVGIIVAHTSPHVRGRDGLPTLPILLYRPPLHAPLAIARHFAPGFCQPKVLAPSFLPGIIRKTALPPLSVHGAIRQGSSDAFSPGYRLPALAHASLSPNAWLPTGLLRLSVQLPPVAGRDAKTSREC